MLAGVCRVAQNVPPDKVQFIDNRYRFSVRVSAFKEKRFSILGKLSNATEIVAAGIPNDVLLCGHGSYHRC